MSNDLRDKRGYSNEQLRALATLLRKAFGVDEFEQVDILACLKSGWVQTICGKKRLVFEIVADQEMGGRDATAESGPGWARIRCKASVADQAARRIGRAVMTLAHELGHVVLDHRRATMARTTGATASDRPKYLRAFESSESLADRFAAYFLIREEFAEKYQSVEEIAGAFGVSLKAAQICFEKLQDKRAKPRIMSGFRSLLGELKGGAPSNSKVDGNSNGSPGNDNDRQTRSYDSGILLGVCPRCGRERNRRAMGNRFECLDCGCVGDQLADGDSFGD